MDTSAIVDILLKDHGRDLWSMHFERERSRFLRKTGRTLKSKDLERLVSAIMEGPPRSMYRSDLSTEQFQEIAEREIWRDLAKLKESGAELPPVAEQALLDTESRRGWKLSADHRDEFPIWTGDIDDLIPSSGSFLERLKQRTPLEAANLLASEKVGRIELLDAWRTLCAEKPPTLALSIMNALLSQQIYDQEIWRMAFSAFWGRPEAEWQPVVWRQLIYIVREFPDPLCLAIANNLSGWMSTSAKLLSIDEEPVFWPIWERFWQLSVQVIETSSGDPLHAALNHPSGQLAEAILTRLFKRKLEKDNGLPGDLRGYFESIGTASGVGGVMGRVILCSRLNNLYLLDRKWTTEHLLAKLDWKSSEAQSLWHGYLWAPRCSPELLGAFKKSLLEAIQRGVDFGEKATNLYRLFIGACIYIEGGFTLQEMRKGIHSLDAKALAEVLRFLSELMRGAEDKALTLWNEKIATWLQEVWPVTKEKHDERTSTAAAEMAINGGEAFPLILKWASDFLVPSQHIDRLLWQLKESNLTEHYPQQVLKLLSKVVPDNAPSWAYHGLAEIVQRMSTGSAELLEQPSYKRLVTLGQKWVA